MKVMIQFSVFDFIKDVIRPLIFVSIIPIMALYFSISLINSEMIRAIVTCIGFYMLYVPLVYIVAFTRSERTFIKEYIKKVRHK